jgi:hypothetical protein
MDETSLGDSNAPVWQQLLPSSSAAPGAAQSTERAVRIDIPSAATPTDSETTTRQTRSSTSSWLNFASSWVTRDRTSSAPVNGVYRQAINSITDSTADDVLLQSNSGVVEEKGQPPSASSPLMK